MFPYQRTSAKESTIAMAMDSPWTSRPTCLTFSALGDWFIMMLIGLRSDLANHNLVALNAAGAEFNPRKGNQAPTLPSHWV